MESREILIANTKTQKRNKITTDATTLGELKASLDANGIDYSGMEFTEGITKTKLLDDATQLPKDVMYKGAPTNQLVILLTNTKKNIASGEGSRQEAYALIKANNLQDVIKAKYGKNYTVMPTANLWTVINVEEAPEEPASQESAASTEPAEETNVANTSSDSSLLTSLLNLIISLEQAQQVSASEIDAFAYKLLDYTEFLDKSHDDYDDDDDYEEEPQEPVSTTDGSITDDDIDNMLDELDM